MDPASEDLLSFSDLLSSLVPLLEAPYLGSFCDWCQWRWGQWESPQEAPHKLSPRARETQVHPGCSAPVQERLDPSLARPGWWGGYWRTVTGSRGRRETDQDRWPGSHGGRGRARTGCRGTWATPRCSGMAETPGPGGTARQGGGQAPQRTGSLGWAGRGSERSPCLTCQPFSSAALAASSFSPPPIV